MFVPIQDENPLKSIQFQYMTVLLILANCIVFALEVGGLTEPVVLSFAVVPRELFAVGVFGGPAVISHDGLGVAEHYTLLSYMFFHGDIFHLVGNMLFLWVFGDNVEDAMGHIKFLIFYMLCGIGAGLMHAVVAPNSDVPLIGASGAVAGVIAAYLLLHPRVRVWVLAFRVLPLRISAALALGVWIASQAIMVALPQVGPVAWWSHIGGLVVGAVLILFMRRPGVPLLA